jgi:hypothetical protein
MLFNVITSKPRHMLVNLGPNTKSELFTVCAITALIWPVEIGSLNRRKHISRDNRILDIWRTGFYLTKLESPAKSPIINNTSERVSEALKNTFHPSRNPTRLLVFLYPVHVGEFRFPS